MTRLGQRATVRRPATALAIVICSAIALGGSFGLGAPAASAKAARLRPLTSLLVAPLAQTVNAGNPTVFAVRVATRSSFRGTVSIELRGLPAGASGRLSPSGRRGEARVDIATAPNTPGGTYTLQFVASAPTDQRVATATLVVIGAPLPPPTAPLAPPPPPPLPATVPAPPAPTTTLGSNFSIAAEPLISTVDSGASVSFVVRLAYVGGFDGSVDYRIDGLPAGATAAFSPNPAIGSTVLTVATTTAVIAGNYPLTITATNRGVVRATAVVLAVRAVVDFVLVVDASNRIITPGAGVSWIVTPSPVGDTAAAVTYSVGGLPVGTTAAFSPNPTSGATTLTIQTSTATLNGQYAITITGTRGGFVRSAVVNLTVGAPFAFALAAQPTTASVARSSSALYRIVITQGTYTGPIVIGATGIPTGGGFGLTTNSDGSVSLLVTTSASTPVGSYVLSITGSGGGAQAAIQVTLIVT